MTNLTDLTVAAIRDGVAAGTFSAVEVAEAFNARVAAAQALNAFIVTTPEAALDAARKVDADRAAGNALGKLAGVPIGSVDAYSTRLPATCERRGTLTRRPWPAAAMVRTVRAASSSEASEMSSE